MTFKLNRQRFFYSIQSCFLDQSSLFVLICLSLITILILNHGGGVDVVGIADGRTQWVEAGMTPNGLNSLEWANIQARIAAEPYQVTAVSSGGFISDNPANQWQTAYAANGTTQLTSLELAGATWEWGLKLTGYGYGNGQAVGRPIALVNDGQMLTYQWDENLSEWWINSSEGLEQGFTLLERPQHSTSTSSLVLDMDVIGNLVPVVVGDTVQLQRESGEIVITYDKLHVFDANGRIIPASFSVLSQDDGSYKLLITVDDADAVYPLTIDPTVQQAYVKASNTQTDDRFGRAVAVSGDTVVVAAYWEDSNSTGVNNDETNNLANNSGAAYVFVRSGGTWSQQAYLKASNTDADDWYGWAVAIAGDIIVVGAPFEDSNATGVDGNQADNSASAAGAAYIYVRNGTTWSQQAYLKAHNTDALDTFGISVAVSGETVVVGANLEDSNSTGVDGSDNNLAANSGAAYVFTRSGGIWSQQAYLKASNTGDGDNFGISVAVSNDTIVVGANSEDSDSVGVNGVDNDLAPNSGAAYIFTRSGGIWSPGDYLKASNTDAGDSFGGYVAISGDTAVVAAAAEDSNATGVNGNEANNDTDAAGAAYVFTSSGGTWSQQAYLKASNTEPSGVGEPGLDQFGNSLAIEGDTIIVGAFDEDGSAIGINGTDDNGATDSGAAYLFTRSGGTWTPGAYIKASNTDPGDRFGVSVSVSGDTVLIGARGESSNDVGVGGNQSNNSAGGSGAAYIFREGFCSNQSGSWNSTSTWVGGVVPGSSDAACISIGDTVTLDVAGAVDSLIVYPDAALDLATFGFTAESGVTNHGTLSQTVTVNNNVVNFLEIQNAGATAVQYRGVTIDATDNAQNLGSVEVAVRETVNWYPVLDNNGHNITQYCTSTEENSPTYAQRCFRITPSIQPALPVIVRLWGLTNELNGIVEGNLAVYRHVGGAGSSLWVELTTNAGNGNDAGNYSYAEGDTPGFSSFLLGEAGNSPTAVSLSGSSVRASNSLLILLAVLTLSGLTYFTLQKQKKITG